MNNFEWKNNTNKTRFFTVKQSNFKVDLTDKDICSMCGNIVSKMEGKFIGVCGECNTIVSFYKATPIQELAGVCESHIIFNMGGVGSGKTTLSSHRVSSHMRTIPFANGVCFAQTLDQLKEFILPVLIMFIDDREKVGELSKKTEDLWEFKNGSTLHFWTSKNVESLRSANLTLAWLVEASAPYMYATYKMVQTRLRNNNAIEYERDNNGNVIYYLNAKGQQTPKIKKDKTVLLIESNPSLGWIRDKGLLSCHTIFHTENVKGIDTIKQLAKPVSEYDDINGVESNLDATAFMNASYDNPILKPEFFLQIKQTRSEEEYNRDLYCDMSFKKGLVYGDWFGKESKVIFNNTHDFFINDNDTFFVEGFDPGGIREKNDPTAYLLGAFNTKTKELTLLAEYKASGTSLYEDCKRIWQLRWMYGWVPNRFLIFSADNAVVKTSKVSDKTLKDELELRLQIKVTPCNDKAINEGIKKVTAWSKLGKLKIPDSLVETIDEARSYVWTTVEKKIQGSNETTTQVLPTDKNNHCLDTLRYMIVALQNMNYLPDDDYEKNFKFYENVNFNKPDDPLKTTPRDLFLRRVKEAKDNTIEKLNRQNNTFSWK